MTLKNVFVDNYTLMDAETSLTFWLIPPPIIVLVIMIVNTIKDQEAN
jgi:hypothetical protein